MFKNLKNGLGVFLSACVVLLLLLAAGNALLFPSSGGGSQPEGIEVTEPDQEDATQGEDSAAASKNLSWKKVKSWTTTSSKKTEAFKIEGAQWRIKTKLSLSGDLGLSYVSVAVYKPDADLPVDGFMVEDETSTSYVYEKGVFYLQIIPEGTWQIIVEEYK